MPQVLDPQLIFDDCTEGVITNVKYSLCPRNSVELSVNFVFDEIYGEAVVRQGLTLVGTRVIGSNHDCQGIFNFITTDEAVNKLISVYNGSILYFDGVNWTTSRSGDNTSLKARFASFLDTVVRVNGTDSHVASSNGTTWSTTNSALDLGNMPVGKFVIVYKDQMIIAGNDARPDSLFISSVPNAAGTAISWTTDDREIVINPEDGQNITALGKVSGLLMIFKERSLYTWNNRSTEADSVIEIGCSSQESVANCGEGNLAFFNPSGVWLTSGGQPVMISRKVQEWIDGMDSAYFTEVASAGDEEHLFVSIGSSTVKGKTYNNVVLRYSLNTKEWAVFSYAYKFQAFTLYKDGDDFIIVGGDSTSRVLEVDSDSLTDNGNGIQYEIQSQDRDFGSKGIKKEISERVMAYGKYPSSGLVQVQIDGSKTWKQLGTFKKEVNNFPIANALQGNMFKFRVTGVSSTDRFRFQGLELPHISLLDYSE